MVAYIPNTERNRRLIEKHFTGHLPDSPDFKATEIRCTTFQDEEIESYFWKGDMDNIHVNTFYYDVLKKFVKVVGFKGATYSACTKSYKFKNQQASIKPHNPRKNYVDRLLSLLRL